MSQTVYLLYEDEEYTRSIILGIFSSREKAMDWYNQKLPGEVKPNWEFDPQENLWFFEKDILTLIAIMPFIIDSLANE